MSSLRQKPLFIVAMEATRGFELTPADRLLFGYFAVKQGGDSECWPGVRTIASDLGISHDTVQQSIRRLCSAGLLQKTPGSRGRKHSNRYSICLEKSTGERYISDNGKVPGSGTFNEQKSTDLACKKYRGPAQRRSRCNQSILPSSSRQASRPPKAQGRKPTRFIPPTVEEVRQYAAARGQPDFDAEKFVDYYAAADWHDSKGNPVRSWKQKLLAVWLSGSRGKGKAEPEDADSARLGTHAATDEEIQALEEAGIQL